MLPSILRCLSILLCGAVCHCIIVCAPVHAPWGCLSLPLCLVSSTSSGTQRIDCVALACSVIRFLAQAVLRLLVTDEHPMPEFPRHQDVEYVAPCVTVQFLWRPFAANVSTEFASWAHNPDDVGDIVIAGAALWDVLHVRSIQRYSKAMHNTRDALNTLLAQVGSS